MHRPTVEIMRIGIFSSVAVTVAACSIFGVGTVGGIPAATAAPTYTCGGEVPPARADGSAWVCTYNDEFSSLTLDRTRWTPQKTIGSDFTSGGPSGKACYLDSPRNVSVSGGVVNLTVRKEAASVACGSFRTYYTAGSVSTVNGFSQMNGRFEVRAKLPNVSLAGLQETLWLWPKNAIKYGAWPASGEIDFAELYSLYNGWNIPYIHYNYSQPPNWTTNVNVVTALPAPYAQPGMACQYDPAAFNTYAVTWKPGEIDLYVNGQTCIINHYVSITGSTAAAPFDQPFFLALTQGLGVDANAVTAKTPLPATTSVDYVRVWK